MEGAGKAEGERNSSRLKTSTELDVGLDFTTREITTHDITT